MEVKAPDTAIPPIPLPPGEVFYIRKPFHGQFPETKNDHFNSSLYVLTEYSSPEKRFGAELGLRIDHHFYSGDSINLNTVPVFNPRLNIDYNVLRDRGIVESFDLTVGTGLFSSMNNAYIAFDPDNAEINDYDLRPNRSWTSVLGAKIDFKGGWSFNLEGYFKYIYDRIYTLLLMEPAKAATPVLRSDGNGIVWGFDFMLQKLESRYFDGWLSYTFTFARYHEPKQSSSDFTYLEDSSSWYYPYFHRFHNVNLVMNFKPTKNFNIYIRLGMASGRPMSKVGAISEYTVILLDENNNPVPPYIIKKYKRESGYDDNTRTTWSIPLDLKISYKIFNPRNKVQTEMYLAAENLASLFYVAQANTSFNSYTGTEDKGSDSANYEMPVPMVSVGIKWSF